MPVATRRHRAAAAAAAATATAADSVTAIATSPGAHVDTPKPPRRRLPRDSATAPITPPAAAQQQYQDDNGPSTVKADGVRVIDATVRKSSKAAKAESGRRRTLDGHGAASDLEDSSEMDTEAAAAELGLGRAQRLDFMAADTLKGEEDEDDDDMPEDVTMSDARSTALQKQSLERHQRQQVEDKLKAKRRAIDERNKAQSATKRQQRVLAPLPDDVVQQASELAKEGRHLLLDLGPKVAEDTVPIAPVTKKARKNALSAKLVADDVAVVVLDHAVAQAHTIPPEVTNFKQQHFYGSRLNRASGQQNPLGTRHKVAPVFKRK